MKDSFFVLGAIFGLVDIPHSRDIVLLLDSVIVALLLFDADPQRIIGITSIAKLRIFFSVFGLMVAFLLPHGIICILVAVLLAGSRARVVRKFRLIWGFFSVVETSFGTLYARSYSYLYLKGFKSTFQTSRKNWRAQFITDSLSLHYVL